MTTAAEPIPDLDQLDVPVDPPPSQLPDVRGPIVVDTEGDGLFVDDGAWVSTFQVSWIQDGQVVKYGWPFTQDPTRPEISQLYNLPRSEWDALLDWLASRDGLVWHNAAHDLGVVLGGSAAGWPGRDLLDNTVWDTMLVQRAIEPTEEAGLEKLEPRLFGRAYTKAQHKAEVESHLRKRKIPIKRIGHADWRVTREYAMGDVDITARLLEYQKQRLAADPSPLPWIAWDMRVMKTLVRMERRGLPYDAARSREIAAELDQLCEELDAKLPFVTTPNGAKDWFFNQCKAQPLGYTPKKREPQLDAECIDHLAAQQVPFAQEYADLNRARNAVSKWYQAFADATGSDGRLRCRFRQATVRSGRLSVGRVNLQAIPQDYVLERAALLSQFETPRQLIHGIEGWDLWNMDLAQAELRVGALLAGCWPMLEIINQGRDPHGEIATATFGVRPNDHEWTKYRQVGKRANFSLIFGIGAAKLRADVRKQTGVDLGDREAARLRDTWNRRYPQFGRAIHYWQRRAEAEGYVTLVNGRRSYFAEYERRGGLHKAFNRLVQGSIGAFTQEWMVRADELLMQELQHWPDVEVQRTTGSLGVGLLLQIHDNLVPMVPAGLQGKALAQQVQQIGIDLWPQWFTLDDGRTVPGEIELKPW